MDDDTSPAVHLLVGLNGAGKTTYAKRLAADLPGVRFGLDEWVLRLFGTAYDDPAYPDHAARCQGVIWDLALQVLSAGTDVVLDWNQWSRERRDLWRDRAREAGHGCVVHHLRVPLATAVERAERRTDPHSHGLDAAAVRHLATLIEPPTPDEGGELRVIG